MKKVYMQLLAVILLLLFGIWLNASGNPTHSGHECGYKICPFKGLYGFVVGCGNCAKNDACWALDSLHVVYPYLDYDGLDSIYTNQKK